MFNLVSWKLLNNRSVVLDCRPKSTVVADNFTPTATATVAEVWGHSYGRRDFFSFFSKMASNALVYVTNNSKNNAQFKIKIILFSTVEVKLNIN